MAAKYDSHLIREIAVEAVIDPRTVIAVLDNRPTTNSTSRARVRKAIATLGLDASRLRRERAA